MLRVVAHRGASAAFPPGNTIEAFAEAVEQGADWVELDVHLSLDGHLIVHHDPVLADGRKIGEMTRTQLPEWIPSLAESVAACHPLAVNVEIKPDGVASLQPQLIEKVVELLLSYGDAREFLVTSFDHDIVDRVRGLAPSIPTGLLNADGRTLHADLERAARDGHVAINPWFGSVDQGFVAQAHAVGVAVNVWTVDDPDQMRALADAGVDAIITNVPKLCREVISER